MAVINYFDEILLDKSLFNLGFGDGGPEFANEVNRNPQTGVMSVAVHRLDPSLVWQCNFEDVKFDPSQPGSEGLKYFFNIWYGGLGSAFGFRVRNQFDFFTQGEALGVGDAVNHDFPLTKKYQRLGPSANVVSGARYRRICKPVASAHLSSDSVTLYESDGTTARVIEIPFKVYLDSGSGPVEQTTGWTISNTTGLLHFTSAPGVGVFVSADFQFDVPMRFLINIPQMTATFPAEVKNMPLVEILPDELGINF